jgi:DNA-binding MarR family transcriptional regulator
MNQPYFVTRIARIRKALRREFETRAAGLEITASQLQVLRRLWEGDGITTSVLTQDASSDGGTVTGVLDRLENKGLIRRERSAQDRRAVQIWLTDEGHALEAPLMEIINEINDIALDGLSERQQTQLLKALDKVRANINA